MMLDGIIVLGLARGDQVRRRQRVRCSDQAHLCGFMVMYVEQQEAAALGGAEPKKKGRIRLFVEDQVGSL